VACAGIYTKHAVSPNDDSINVLLQSLDLPGGYRTERGWKEMMDQRFEQVAAIPNSGDRYEGYIQTVHSAFLVPNFTEHGFGLARAPDELTEALRQGIREGLATAGVETSTEVITGPLQPLFVHRDDLTQRALVELRYVLGFVMTCASSMRCSPMPGTVITVITLKRGARYRSFHIVPTGSDFTAMRVNFGCM
jgi:hypothetical protein